MHTTRYTLHTLLYTILYILYASHYTLHTIPYTLYPTHYTLHTIPYTLYPTHYTLHTIPYTLYPTHYTLYTSFQHSLLYAFVGCHSLTHSLSHSLLYAFVGCRWVLQRLRGLGVDPRGQRRFFVLEIFELLVAQEGTGFVRAYIRHFIEVHKCKYIKM